MQVEIDKKELLRMVSLAQTVAEKKVNMPHLANLLLETENDSLKILATDLEISVASKTKVNIIQPGRVTIHAKNFYEIIKELGESQIQLTSQENHWLKIQQKRYHSKLHGSDPNQFPVFPVLGSCEFIKIKPDVLKEMISKVLFCVSNDDTRYHLNAVYLERYWKDKEYFIRLVATDGHKLSVVSKTVDNVSYGDQSNSSFGVIIPRKGVQELYKLLESVENHVEIAIEGAQLVVKHEDTVLLIRLIEGKYPTYQKLIPKEIKYTITLPRDVLSAALRRVSFHAHQKSKSIIIELFKSKMIISSNNTEMGEASEELEIAYNGPDLKINLNGRYFLEILSVSHTELIDIELIDISSPILIKPYGDMNHTSVIMPMRF